MCQYINLEHIFIWYIQQYYMDFIYIFLKDHSFISFFPIDHYNWNDTTDQSPKEHSFISLFPVRHYNWNDNQSRRKKDRWWYLESQSINCKQRVPYGGIQNYREQQYKAISKTKLQGHTEHRIKRGLLYLLIWTSFIELNTMGTLNNQEDAWRLVLLFESFDQT